MAQIPPVPKPFHPLGLGCWIFDRQMWSAKGEAELFATMHAALEHGSNHFDTASGYGAGASETIVGRFLLGRRDSVFLASKATIDETAEQMLARVEASRNRLQTDCIDLYYIHWPRSDRDMRPAMEGLETARSRGWIRAIGVSNFSAEQMEQLSRVGRIDAHQTGYNLLWRHRERDAMAYCREHGIPIVTYSSIAQGILTGKFPRQITLAPGDQRNTVLYFQPEIWQHVYEAVEQLKEIARETERPLHHLAIRWVLRQPGVVCALVGARSPEQVRENAAALEGEIPPEVFDRITTISDDVMRHIPDIGNMYGYSP